MKMNHAFERRKNKPNQTRFDERSEASPILSASGGSSLRYERAGRSHLTGWSLLIDLSGVRAFADFFEVRERTFAVIEVF